MKKILFYILAASTSVIIAQTEPSHLITDRPDKTESSNTVNTGFLQLETGAVYDAFETSANNIDESLKTFAVATTLFRLGLTNSIELRLASEYLSQTYEINNFETSNNGMNGLDLGTKIFLMEERNGLPETALIANLNMPVGNKDFTGNKIIPALILAMSNTLSSNIGLGYNIGVEFTDNDQTIYFISAALGIGLTEKLSCFIESYNFLNDKTNPQLFADAGFTYLISNDLQLDTSAGTTLNDEFTNWFINAGASYRFRIFN